MNPPTAPDQSPRGEPVPALQRRPLSGYVAAVGLVAASLLLRLLLHPWVGLNVPFLQFFPAVILAAWFGGFGPGVVATMASAASAMYFFLPPAGIAIGGSADAVSLGLFVLIGLGIAWLTLERRRAELAHRGAAALAEARAQRLAAIIETTVDAIIVIDSKGTVESFNQGARRLFGYTSQEVVGRNVKVLMPSPDREAHDGYIARYLTTGEPRIIGTGREVLGQRRDGTTFPLHLSVGEMVVDGERKFTGMLHDLSARVQLEHQLRASEARWRAIIESAVDAVIVIDARGRVETFNPAAERLFGYDAAQVLGRNVDMLMPSPYREEHDGYLAAYLATGHAKIIGIGRDVTGQRKNGTTFPVHLSVGEIVGDGERRFTGILHDLSARVRMEEQLREQAALVKLGEMAAVVAHEVKNPLAGIRGAIEVLAGRQPAGSGEKTLMAEIIARIDSLNEMMKDLLLFARPPQLRPRPMEVVPLIASAAGLLARDPALEGVEVVVQGGAPPVSADPEILKIVFHNLLVNGAHAMRGRGRIEVAVTARDGTCDISFADAGPGIPAEIRDKIFTPFFTTKSRGTGLGLPTARRLIEAHRGRIDVHCPAEGGTRVIVQLPIEGG
jgi:PAS domain S-box-containing protein